MDSLLLDEIFDLHDVHAHVDQLLHEGLLPPKKEVLHTFCILITSKRFLHRQCLLHFASAFLSLWKRINFILFHETKELPWNFIQNLSSKLLGISSKFSIWNKLYNIGRHFSLVFH